MAPPALLSDARPVAPGDRFDVSPSGVALVLRIPAGEVLDTATLKLAAASNTPAWVTPQTLRSDVPDFPAGKAIRFVTASFDGEVAVSSLTLTGAAGMARVRTLSNGAWSPLSPIDTVGLGLEQVFPAVAAQSLIAEFLAPNLPQAPVAVPTPLTVTAISVKATPQPCRVSLAIGDDPAFFTVSGPLPTVPVGIDGLGRIAARWLLDHPGTAEVPLRISAAGRGSLVIAAFEATSVAAPAAPQPGNGTSGAGSGPPAPRPLPAPPDTRRALLCDEGHTVGQRFAAAPSGQALGTLAMWVRPGPGAVTGSVSLFADDHGKPAEPALAGAMDFAITAAGAGGTAAREPRWLALSPTEPVRLSQAWWAVCRVTQGEVLWYRASAAPPATGSAAAGPAVSLDGGAWQDAVPDPLVSGLQAEPVWVPVA